MSHLVTPTFSASWVCKVSHNIHPLRISSVLRRAKDFMVLPSIAMVPCRNYDSKGQLTSGMNHTFAVGRLLELFSRLYDARIQK